MYFTIFPPVPDPGSRHRSLDLPAFQTSFSGSTYSFELKGNKKVAICCMADFSHLA